MKFAIHDQHGRISQTCTAPSTEGLAAITPPGFSFCEVADDVSDAKHYIHNGLAVEFPPRPDEHHQFDYAAKAWLDNRTIEQLRAARWTAIKAARQAAEVGGFEFDGKVYDSNAVAVQRIGVASQAAAAAIAAGLPFERQWTTRDNSVVALSAAQVVQLQLALAAHVDAVHQRAAGLRVLIDVATTRQKLDAIVW